MKIDTFVLCEDVRRELGHKFSMMGVLTDTLSFQGPDADVWPKPTNFAAFIRTILDEGDDLPDNFSVTVAIEGEVIATVEGAIPTQEGLRIINIPAVMSGLPLISKGKMDVEFSASVGDKVLIKDSRSLVVSATTAP